MIICLKSLFVVLIRFTLISSHFFLEDFSLSLQIDDVFAKGDLDEIQKSVEAMKVVGLEAAEARDKLTRVEMALMKVLRIILLPQRLKKKKKSFKKIDIEVDVAVNRDISSQMRLYVGDRVRVRDRDDPWQKGTVKELIDGRSKVQLDGSDEAYSWGQVQLLVSAELCFVENTQINFFLYHIITLALDISQLNFVLIILLIPY